MRDKLKSSYRAVIAFACAVVVIGAVIMSAAHQTGAPQETRLQAKTAQAQSLSLPGAGMGGVLDDYVGAAEGSSVDLLSTVSLTSGFGDTVNAYYDEEGNTIGRLIVYTGSEAAEIYDQIPGNQRMEAGETQPQVIAHMYAGDVATLTKEQGDWYQIISDSINGFVKKDGFARGIEAEKLDSYTYVNAVYAGSSEVWMYQSDSDTSTVLCKVPEYVRCTLLEAGSEFSEIYVPYFGEGWIKNSDVICQPERRQAVSLVYENAAYSLVLDGAYAAVAVEEDRQAAEVAAAEEAAVQEALTVYDGDVNLNSVAPEGIVPPGTFVVPLNGQLSSGYGWRWGALHQGNDYWCAFGEPIYASCAGIVIEAGWSTWGYGNYVLIQHDDHFVTRYAHMSSLNCTAGQVVNQYDVIGFAGATGDASGVHCHFEIIVDGVPYDPNLYLS